MSTVLDRIKSDVVDKVIKELSDMSYMTKTEKQLYINSLKSAVNSKKLATQVRTQSDITNANDYNNTAFELYLDMLTTFEYINELYATINSHHSLNESIVNTLHSTIAELNDKLDEYVAVMATNGAPECFIEGFRTQNNQENNTKYYTERYGELMPESTYVRFNTDQENITLNYTRQQNVMVYKSGVQLGDISIEKQYGSGFIKAKNSETQLKNAIDTSMSSYWAETILSDTELKVQGLGFENSNGGVMKYNRSYYDLPKGALCEICLTFEALTKVNELVLKPFGNFPIDIIAIRYALSDDEDDECYDILCPDNIKHEWLQETSIRQEHAFHFPEVTCKKMYILLNQLHCIKNTYLMSSNQMFKNELWFNATYNELKNNDLENTTVFQPLYIDRTSEDNVWRYINNKMLTSKNIDVNDILINNKEKYVPVTKYQYTYGFYNIAPNFVEFQKAGVYVSQEIEIDGAIDTIRITTEEEHFLSNEGDIVTDIEFYITTQQNPAASDWKSICPTNKDYIHNELLQLDYDYCYLRHPAVCGNIATYNKDGSQSLEMIRPKVKMNDIEMIEDADYILRYDDNGDVIAIEISNIDHFALYTVSYQPVDSSKTLSLMDDENPIPTNSYEEIIGNGTACYELYNYAYYSRKDPELTSSYVKIINAQTNKVITQTNQMNSPIQCVTNKQNPDESYKNFIANTNKIQYYIIGKYIYFNRPIKNTERIEVNYPSFASKIRLKAILRRNTKKESWITPVLNRYKLEFTTI